MFVCIYLSISPSKINSKDETSNEDKLAPSSCTVVYKQLYRCTMSTWCYLVRPKPISANKEAEYKTTIYYEP